PEQVHPPRAHAVHEAAAVEVLQPRTLAARHRHQREALVRLHLRAGVPDGGEAAGDEVAVVHGAHSGESRFTCAASALVASVASGSRLSSGIEPGPSAERWQSAVKSVRTST